MTLKGYRQSDEHRAKITDAGKATIILKNNACLLQYKFEGEVRRGEEAVGQLQGIVIGFGINALAQLDQAARFDIVPHAVAQVFGGQLGVKHGRIGQAKNGTLVVVKA